MTEQDCNAIALKSLPISTQPLMDYNNLYTLNQKRLESVFLAPPPDWKAYGPGGDLFQHPIQIVVLGVQGDEVNLGIYAHPSLTLAQGPTPDEQWAEAQDHPSPAIVSEVEPNQGQEPLSGSEPELAVDAPALDPDRAFMFDLCDDMYDLQAAYQYFCLTVKPILQSEEHWDTSRKSQHGYAILLDWILERGDRLLESLDQCLKTSHRES